MLPCSTLASPLTPHLAPSRSILGVASGLKKAGHDVLFITHHSYKGLVELWGLRFGPGNPYDPQLQARICSHLNFQTMIP